MNGVGYSEGIFSEPSPPAKYAGVAEPPNDDGKLRYFPLASHAKDIAEKDMTIINKAAKLLNILFTFSPPSVFCFFIKGSSGALPCDYPA